MFLTRRKLGRGVAVMKPADIGFAEVHDCFTIAELIATEDLGFFPPGGSWCTALAFTPGG